ncbi:hypothetical protein LDENG_00222070 [Lucifuga dentata]|nr:hypothetical protein LDENG_00222070 [Lucifuga dentata]
MVTLQYISELLQTCSSSRSLRSSEQILLVAPCTRFKTRRDGAFGVVAPKLWNELASSLCFIDSEKAFKKTA